MENLNEKLLALYRFISDNYKSNADDIFCLMELLLESIRDSRNLILKSVHNKNDFDKISELTEYGKFAESVADTLSAYLDFFATVSTNENDDMDDENSDIEKTIPNYKDYEVDTEIPYLLTESFTHKKICGFFLDNTRYNVDNWKTALVKVCELLYAKDPTLFKKIISSDRFAGSKIEYFSTTNKGKYYKKLKNANIYVWTCHSANAICSLIRRLLLEYNISSNSLYIYLRADYTPLHSNIINNNSDIIVPETNDEVKIGKFVKTTMRNLSTYGYNFDKQTLGLLISDEETKKIFGIGTSFLKEVKDEAQIQKLIKDSNGYNRYWREIFEFNGKKFIIVSQWTKHNADRFKTWLYKLPNINKYINK